MRSPAAGVAAAAVLCLAILAAAPRAASAQPAVPTPPHPRLLLDDTVRAAWKKQASQANSAVARAVERCAQLAKNPKEFSRDLYMGLDWAGYLQNCLVAWAATGKDAHANTAMTYFVAMLDDLDNVGDGKGGNNAARRDSGFAMRAMGPYTALAYDWLHDHPRMTEPLRARARERFEAWTTWYLASGYRARSPSTNYHAGYLVGATFIAIAQNGEAGKYGNDLWRLVRDDLWGRDMAGALGPGGSLDGGDWGEGWQYGPLSVAEYAISARAMAQQGSAPAHVREWLDAILRRHVHALSPGAMIFIGGDTQNEQANLPPNFLTLAAVVLGDASPDAKSWAAHEIQRLKLQDDTFARQFALYGALAAAAGVTPVPVPRDSWPTNYLARGMSNFYARSHWGKDAVWTVMQCSKTVDVDHMHPDAGNVVLSRGPDDLLVDPSPYGTLSSVTSNAPTVESKHLPDEYKPSQAYWSEKTGFRWAHQTASGITVARCDYADQYKFQDRPSDVPAAQRDFVVFPWDGGRNATMVVIDRAKSGDPSRGLHLRFRTQAKLTKDGAVGGRGTRGSSSFSVRQLWTSGGTGELRSRKRGDCFGADTTRGGCDIPRFEIDEWTLVVPGPTMEAAHLLDAAPSSTTPPPAVIEKQGAITLITATRSDASFTVAVGPSSGSAITYRAAAGTHVVLDAPADATVSATAAASACTVTVSSSGAGTKLSGRPAIFTLTPTCTVTASAALSQPLPTPTGTAIDAGSEGIAAASDASSTPTSDGSINTPSGTLPRSARSGCCGAQAAPGSSILMALLVLLFCLRRRGSRVVHTAYLDVTQQAER